MSPEQIAALLKEATETLKKPKINKSGNFTFDYFMTSQALINKYWHVYSAPLIAQRTVARRALYAQEDFDAKVRAEIMAQQVWHENSQELINE